MAKNNELGTKGEEAAVSYLCQQGYKIVFRNHRLKHYEIDVICEKDGFIVFVEVKTRQSSYFGEPEDAVGRRKMKYMIEAAELYLQHNNIDKEVRFDIIACVGNGKSFDIRHIEDAFMAGLD